MTATYFHKRGDGHSIRGKIARDSGARPWSKLPARLRRGLTTKQAAELRISGEWHHAGKYASEVPVYYLDQVAAFWDRLDNNSVTADQLASLGDYRTSVMRGDSNADTSRQVVQAWSDAVGKAEDIRCQITGETC